MDYALLSSCPLYVQTSTSNYRLRMLKFKTTRALCRRRKRSDCIESANPSPLCPFVTPALREAVCCKGGYPHSCFRSLTVTELPLWSKSVPRHIEPRGSRRAGLAYPTMKVMTQANNQPSQLVKLMVVRLADVRVPGAAPWRDLVRVAQAYPLKIKLHKAWVPLSVRL